LVLVAALALGGLSCARPAPADPRVVSEWIHTLYGLVRAERLTPPVASRLFAYASVALYEGMAAATPGLPSAAGTLNGLDSVPRLHDPESLDATLVATAAERTLLDSLLRQGLPTTLATLARLSDSVVATRPMDAARRERSIAAGEAIGQTIVAWSRTDGFAETRGLAYTPPVGPALWVNDAPASIYGAQNLSGASQAVALGDPTVTLRPGSASDRALVMNRPKVSEGSELAPVDMAGATEPYWGRLRPFLLATWNECPIPAPPPYATDPGSALYREAMEIVEIKAKLTEEEKAISLYWADNPGETATPAGHWIAIASQLTSERGLTAEAAARLFLVGAVAQADAFLATWGYKYQYNQIRPRTYIRRVIDPAWEPQVPTPPFPEYPSGHSTQSAAASVALQALLGDAPFDDSSGVAIGHPVRRFNSFAEAAEQAGYSRLYGGIHFHSGKTGGKEVGLCVGTKAVERLRAAGVL
jgi:hypothetical protein